MLVSLTADDAEDSVRLKQITCCGDLQREKPIEDDNVVFIKAVVNHALP